MFKNKQISNVKWGGGRCKIAFDMASCRFALKHPFDRLFGGTIHNLVKLKTLSHKYMKTNIIRLEAGNDHAYS